MPIDCKKAYIVVEPTKENPFFLSSLLILSDRSVRAGTSSILDHEFKIGYYLQKTKDRDLNHRNPPLILYRL